MGSTSPVNVPVRWVADAEVVEGVGAATGGREVADAAEAVVVEEHDGQRDAFLVGRQDLVGEHEVGAVADHHVDPSLGFRHGHAEATGDLVAHGGVAVLHVVRVRAAGAPDLVQVAGQAAGRADDHAVLAGSLVDEADDLGLGDVLGRRQVADSLDLVVPLDAQALDRRPALRGGPLPAACLQGLLQLRQGDPGVALQRQGRSLAGVHLGHVDGHERRPPDAARTTSSWSGSPTGACRWR